jgi:hypothetical protein
VPLSDLEKRMMYFTETDECPEDPTAQRRFRSRVRHRRIRGQDARSLAPRLRALANGPARSNPEVGRGHKSLTKGLCLDLMGQLLCERASSRAPALRASRLS